MSFAEIKINNNKLILPKQLSRKLKWKYPLHKLPELNDYSKKIVSFSKKKNQLPFYSKFDINNDGKEEVILIQKSIIGGYGRLLIVSYENSKYEIEKINWDRPVNSLFFDYLIDQANPQKYQKFGLTTWEENNESDDSLKQQKIVVNYQHIITKGYLNRIVYWDGIKYKQETVAMILK